ncbi:DUF4184 family protein [Paenibacillus sp. FJAT-27812]|uniref:DUF4184 family protein n=1 Tax=Paenibacillus sp. FJAT-27812 TaxID=1684143 RepID=UPI0006A7BC27|nr:DUF4184 family protein [Paenibacillus sp. FJAT-27812]
MPFTLSHPLFAAPLKKGIPSLSLTGLILGSMAPDLEYFIAMQPFRSIGHSFSGFFLLALPICVALAFAFHRIIKPALPAMLPNARGVNQFAAYLNRPWKMATTAERLFFLLSLFIGFYSHVFLDHFTHSSGYFVLRLPVLQSMIFGDHVYHILQLSLSVLGAFVPCLYFMYSYLNWYKKRDRNKKHNNSRGFYLQWGLAISITFVLFLGKLLFSGNFFSISIWVVAPITSAFVGLYVTAMLQMAVQSRQKRLGILYALLLLVIIVGYKLFFYQSEFSITVWVVYHWILSAVIVASTYLSRGRSKSN